MLNSNTMTYNPQQYETVYGFSMLDELHNFMPELLYDETMFPNEMVAYFRHRMGHLFQPTFVRQQHIYNMYMSEARRAAFDEWRRSRTAAPVVAPPAGVPDILTALNNAFAGNTGSTNIRMEIPLAPATPQAQIRRRATVELPSNANAVGQTTRTAAAAPGAEPTTNTPPPPRRQRNPNQFITANELYHLTTPTTGNDVNSFLNILTGAMLGGIDVPITTTVGNRGFWREVDVVATPAQIAAGSTVVEEATIGADINCAICQEHTYAERENSHQWRRLHCAHQFHRECVDSWLEQSVHCPVCRADIRTPGGSGSGSGSGSTPPGGAGGSYAAAARRAPV
jgi:Ring finger domain